MPRPTEKLTSPASRPVVAPATQNLPAEPEPAPDRARVAGGTLHIHLEAEPVHLNPLLDSLQVISRVVTDTIYETLLDCHGTDYLPGLAESWEVSPDGLRILIKPRGGVRWHDDRLFTVVDVQATLESIVRSSSRLPLPRIMLSEVTAVEITPERMIRLRLARPSPMVLRGLCEIPMLPEWAVRGGSTAAMQIGKQPIGTGPFRFAGWERGRRIRLSRNRQPWGLPALLDEVVFDIDTDGARALQRTRRGEIDVLPHLLEIHYPDQIEPASLRETLAVYRLTPERYSFLALNHRHDLMADRRFRSALNLLWDRNRLASEAHHGLVRPLGGPPFGATPPPPFDRARANRILDEAGYRDSNGDGVRERAGVPIRLTFLEPAGSRAVSVEARALATELRRAGLLLDIVPVDAMTWSARLQNGSFDMAPVLWEGRPDEDPRGLFGSNGELAFMGYHSDRLSDQMEQIRAAPDSLARRPLLRAWADLLADELPVIFLYRHDSIALVSRRVHGLSGHGDTFDLRSVWVDP